MHRQKRVQGFEALELEDVAGMLGINNSESVAVGFCRI